MTTVQVSDKSAVAYLKEQAHVYTGAAAAAFVAGGIGSLVLGLMTVLAEMGEGIANMLKWVAPVGPLSGKTSLAVIAWLVSWFILNKMWKGRDFDLKKAFIVSMVLIGLAFLMTFPPFFVLFAAE
ncbi:MAG: hypothetical protein R6X34_25870 [Chloroflexota bacterium]